MENIVAFLQIKDIKRYVNERNIRVVDIYTRYIWHSYFGNGNIPPPTPVDTVREGQNFKLVSKCNRYGLSHVKVRKIKCKPTWVHPCACCPYTIIQTINEPKITTLQTDSSHFPSVTLKCINEAISSRK